MSTRSAPSRTRLRIATIGARYVGVFVGLGLFATLINRGGGGGHSCPAGSRPSDCSYPRGPWHWGHGIAFGVVLGLIAFTVWLLIDKRRQH